MARFMTVSRTTRRLFRPSLLAGVLIILGFLAMAIAAPVLAPRQSEGAGRSSYRAMRARPQPPSAEHPLGMLPGEVDVLQGIVWGSRGVFRVGLAVVAVRALIGVAVGLVAGYAGKVADAVLMRITDGFLAFPMIAAAMVMLALVGFASDPNANLLYGYLPTREELIVQAALILFGWMTYARLIRANVLVEREKEYVLSARAAGIGRLRLLFRHLLPNSTQGMLVMMASDVGAVVVTLLAFVFIGLITFSSDKLVQGDWGQMLVAGRDWIVGGSPFAYWYAYLPLSLVIVLFAAGWNLIGDGLRDALDPRMQ
ncbi:MAG TPA: ABC transporter permease [Anaerolineae bacterium]|nr:ABC transporter permease [Anaerolineae bacterium]